LLHQRSSIEICTPLYIRHVDGKNLSLSEAYRMKDYEYSLTVINEYEHSYPREVQLAKKRIHGTMGRYYYLMGNMKKSRTFLLKSGINIKNLLYYLTTFWGSRFVKKHFKVFG